MAPLGRHPALTDSAPEASPPPDGGAVDASPASPPSGRRDGVRRRLGAAGVYGAYRAGSVVARALPAGLAYRAAGAGGLVMARTMKGRRAMLERHLRRVHGPGLAGDALDAAVRRTFASYARYWVDSFRLPGTTPDQLAADMTWEGLEHVERASAAGKGVILALPHLGGWDFGGAWFASIGFPMVAVMEAIEPPQLFSWIAGIRRSMGIDIVALGPGAGAAVIKRLRAGAVVALVCDRDLDGSGVEVDFFGERTTLPGGPATLALRSGAAVVPSAVYYRDDGGHHATMGAPLDTTRQGRLRDDVARVTQALAVELERSIRKAPEQWHLLQPNWPSDRVAIRR